MPYPFSEPVRQALLFALPALGMLLALLQPLAVGRRWLRIGSDVGLGLLVVLGFGVWSNNNWENRRYFNPYEFFHYYVGAKYAPELGYTRLYDAAVLVDRETGFQHELADVANLEEGAGSSAPEYKRLGRIWREEQEIKAPFTPARWEEFRRDVVFFRDQLAPSVWERLLHDKGYNPPPAWTMVGSFFAHAAPTDRPARVHALAWLDPLLLALGLASVAWAFGGRAALFVAALYLTHYCTGHAHFRAAFLRTDWLVALLVSASLLRRGHFASAGALACWAAVVRVFPLLFAFWAPARIVLDLVHRRAPERSAMRFAAGFALAGALVFAVTLAWGGLEPWRGFWVKIAEHDARPASDTVGFRELFLWTIAFDPSQGAELRALIQDRRWAWFVCQAFFAVALALVLQRRLPHESFALGFVLVWCLTAPAYYYYALLCLPALHCAARVERWSRATGLALVFATGLVARAVHPGREMTLEFAFVLSAALGVLALYLTLTAALEREEPGLPA